MYDFLLELDSTVMTWSWFLFSVLLVFFLSPIILRVDSKYWYLLSAILVLGLAVVPESILPYASIIFMSLILAITLMLIIMDNFWVSLLSMPLFIAGIISMSLIELIYVDPQGYLDYLEYFAGVVQFNKDLL